MDLPEFRSPILCNTFTATLAIRCFSRDLFALLRCLSFEYALRFSFLILLFGPPLRFFFWFLSILMCVSNLLCKLNVRARLNQHDAALSIVMNLADSFGFSHEFPLRTTTNKILSTILFLPDSIMLNNVNLKILWSQPPKDSLAIHRALIRKSTAEII